MGGGLYVAMSLRPVPWEPLSVIASTAAAAIALLGTAVPQLLLIGQGLSTKQAQADELLAKQSAFSWRNVHHFFCASADKQRMVPLRAAVIESSSVASGSSSGEDECSELL